MLQYIDLPHAAASPNRPSMAQLMGSDPSRMGGLLGRIYAKYGDRIDAIDRYRAEMHAERFVGDERNDAADAKQGFHFARELEHKYAEVLMEPRPLQNALRLFPIDTSVPPGAKFHTIHRIFGDGEVKVYRGSSVPAIGMIM